MVSVTYIVSDVDHAPFFENTFSMIDKSKFTISLVLLAERTGRFEKFIQEMGMNYKRINYSGKKDYPKAIWQTMRFLLKVKPDIIHTHLGDASVIGMTAGKLAGIRRRVYTRHGGTHRDFMEGGRKYEKIIQSMSTNIVATCENVKEILMEEDKVKAEKITIINLAFETERFYHPDQEIVKALVQKYNPHNRHPVIGVISRWIGLKGINYIIPAFRDVLKEYPNALLFLCNARGNQEKEIRAMLADFSPEQVITVPFEINIYELYQVFDIFVHVTIGKHYEAFGQIYVEALAAGIPSVFTLTGIAPEIIQHEYNALVVDYKNADQIRDAILRLMRESELRTKLIRNGKDTVRGRFEFERYIKELEDFYSGIMKKRA